jgi:hypothetical protein
MAGRTRVTGIDHDSWQMTILPLPKGHSRGSVYGFCGGHAVGHAEKLRSGSFGCWWPDGKPALLELDGKKYVVSATANGDSIPGHWRDEASVMRASAWVFRDGELQQRTLHTESFEQTWATACGDGLVIGMGKLPPKPGQYSPNVGIVWRDGLDPVTVVAESDVALFATDGQRIGGSMRGRAALWRSLDALPIDLSPVKMEMSELRALDGDLQIGSAFRGFRARTGVWSGTPASFVDLTPKGFETSGATGGRRGYQVGFVRRKENTRGGSPGSDNCAVLWQGAADRWVDLQALLPSKYNASRALCIHIQDDTILVGGEASQFELTHPGTPHEGHAVPVAHPVLWTATLTR